VSFELRFWKPTPALRETDGLVCLCLDAVPLPGLFPLDGLHLAEQVEHRFPGWEGEREGEWRFACEFRSTHFSLSLWQGTPQEVVTWFLEFAARNGLVVFDPQSPGAVTAADEKAFRARKRALRAQAAAEEAALVEEEARAEFAALLEAAMGDDPASWFALGQRYSFGEGVAADPAEAARWYRAAAEAGEADAMTNLAALLRNGKGVQKDPAAAARWLEKAVAHDPLWAAFELAGMFAQGEGVGRDPERAAALYRLAGEHGHPEARRALRLLTERT
jgi:Sel1 repeat